MTVRLADLGVRVVLLDIEGTTTPIAFVHAVLFPYARARLRAFLDARGRSGEVERFLALMDGDSKSPDLKELQGLIWEAGYQAGALRGQVFPDVPIAFRRWRAAGLQIAIYSSGSELAQRRLFESTLEGNLTSEIEAFFDTAVGAKRAASSYGTIASRLDRAPRDLLFVSDVTAELSAAEAAGCQAVLSLRPGNPDQPDAARFRQVTTFDELA